MQVHDVGSDVTDYLAKPAGLHDQAAGRFARAFPCEVLRSASAGGTTERALHRAGDHHSPTKLNLVAHEVDNAALQARNRDLGHVQNRGFRDSRSRGK